MFEDGTIELYGVEDDIGETRDLKESHPGKAVGPHKRLRAWRKEVGAQMPTANPEYNAGGN